MTWPFAFAKSNKVNHFIELQEIGLSTDPVYKAIAESWGLFDGQLVIMVHSGSRGFGHGLGEWAFDKFKEYCDKNRLPYPDRELVYAPIETAEAQQYFRHVAAGANFALANRLLMAKAVKTVMEKILKGCKVGLLYEISHNLAQWEPDEKGVEHLVHRKGTTRALPARHPMLDGTMWEQTGHPVITPGSMGTFSAIQVGLPGAIESYYSINHGAGRLWSRSEAKKKLTQSGLNAQMEKADILFNGRNAPVDEAPQAYKDLNDVLEAVAESGLAALVATCRPIASMKGGEDGGHQKRKKPMDRGEDFTKIAGYRNVEVAEVLKDLDG